MHIIRLAALAVCLVTASSSIAAPFLASGGDAFPPQANSSPIAAYQDQSSKVSCPITNDCAVEFKAITGSRVLIMHVSCNFGLPTGDSVYLAALGAKGQAAQDSFPVDKMAEATGGTSYVINAQTYLFFEQGRVPSVGVISTAKPVQNLQCTISGYHA